MMCGFAGFFDTDGGLTDEKYLWLALIRRMAGRLSHRGPDSRGARVSDHCALAHAGLKTGCAAAQPMTFKQNGFTYTIVSDSEVYNAPELREELRAHGFLFETTDGAEIILKSYIQFGEDCAQKINGTFAFAIEDERRGQVFLCRDRFGAKPLFYTVSGDRLVFASEIKSLFEYPGVQPKVGRTGLCELFGTAPVRTPGCGVYENISEVRPGHFITFDKSGFTERPYFTLSAVPYTQNYAETKAAVRALSEDAVRCRANTDAPACVLNDSADAEILAALAEKCNDTLKPFSPPDRENTLFKPPYLTDAVIAQDLPCMTDITLFSLCRAAKKDCSVMLSGAGSDAVFGGYPWFFEETPNRIFPWSTTLPVFEVLLKPEILEILDLKAYTQKKYTELLESVPLLRGESAENRRFREMTYLSLYGPMMTELEQLDRFGMANGLKTPSPYTDHRLISLLFNTPKAVRAPNGTPKGLLYDACRDLLPTARPNLSFKTHAPQETQNIDAQLFIILRDSAQPLHKLLSENAVHALLAGELTYPEPIVSYLLQINIWLNRYKVKLSL